MTTLHSNVARVVALSRCRVLGLGAQHDSSLGGVSVREPGGVAPLFCLSFDEWGDESDLNGGSFERWHDGDLWML